MLLKYFVTYMPFCLLIIFIGSLLCHKVQAQTADTSSYHLTEVSVIQNKQQRLQTSKKVVEIDSSILLKYSNASLAQLLSDQGTLHIKSYGNGNIATTSIRGGNANQTAVLWNGLNIQNSMLGLSDLSLISNFLFDGIHLEYGGGSALWGSSAMGGSIHLQNKPLFNKGITVKTAYNAGSFGLQQVNSMFELSYKKCVSITKFYVKSAKNNYTYKDTTDKEQPNKQLTHANYTSNGLLQEFSFLVNNRQKINLRAWYNITDRNLPSYSTIISKQNQKDENLKLSGDWTYNKGAWNIITRLAYFDDAINYNDSIINVFNKSKVKTLIAEIDNTYIKNNHSLNFGVNGTGYEAKTENYSKTHSLKKVALFAAYKIDLLESKFQFHIALRKEFTTQTEIPFTGNSGITYQLMKRVRLKINTSQSYRQPTLNDLYWNPGGNPNLKPEESIEIDGGIEYSYTKMHFSFKTEGTCFSRNTTNWIMWLPTNNAYWSPVNIANVYSRGTETKTELHYFKNHFSAKCILTTAYVLSTNQKSISENDNSLGKQLIYTPRYTGAANLILIYKTITVLYNQNYTGYRFTSTDNSSWLNPYCIGNMRLSYDLNFKSSILQVFGSINNIFNKNYMVVANRPMMMRNYEIGLALSINKKTTNNLNK